MNRAPYCSANPPVESTLIGPARFTAGWPSTILTPGCSGSVVRKIVAHSCALLIAYFSVTSIVASGCPSSGSTSAISCPVRIESTNAWSADSVIGIGQNSPLAVLMPSQTPCQSA